MKRLILLSLVVIAAVSCAKVKEQTIFIISTNDVHGDFDNIARLATLVDMYRSQDTATVILVDAGDRWTGNPFVDEAKQTYQPIIELYNKLGYDFVTFGNHEFDRFRTILNQRTAEANYQVVLSNMVSENSDSLTQPAKYLIREINGTRIIFEGFITNYINGHPDGNDENFEGLKFTDPITAARSIGNLHHNGDVVVAITHIGYEQDSLLAVELGREYFDVIIGGHSHTVNAVNVNEVEIGQSGSIMQLVGVTTLRLRGHKLVSVDYKHISPDSIPPKPEILAMIEHYLDVPYLQEQIGVMEVNMTKTGGEVNFFTDRIREELGTQIGLYHIGGVRIKNGIPAGVIKRAYLFAMEPFRSHAYRLTMPLDSIKKLIINTFNEPKGKGEADIFPSGMVYTILTEINGNKLRAVDVDFDIPHPSPTGIYSVAISDYIYKNYRHITFPPVEDTTELLSAVFERYFEKHRNFTPDNTHRIKIKPLSER